MQRADLVEVEQFVGLGSVLAGKYRLLRLLGVGGMGAVVAAEHLQLGEAVAIKFLLPSGLGKEREAARFLREARAASSLKSPHVARVFDVDVRADGTPYIVMEYLRGETLASLLKRGPVADIPRMVDDMLDACEAIAEAHSRGIVHRDLKPANLFLAEGTGNILVLKVLDFGISKLLAGERASSAATTGDAFLGSPPYMSPEQLTQPDRVDHRTDIWSLGVVLYECVTGTSPFKGESIGEVCALVLQTSPQPVDALRPQVPPALAALIARCMEKSAALRYGSVLELARELAPLGTGRGQRALGVIEAVARLPEAAPPEASGRRPTDLGPGGIDTGTLSAAAVREGSSSSTQPAGPRFGPRLWVAFGAAIILAAVIWGVGRASLGVAPASSALDGSAAMQSSNVPAPAPTPSALPVILSPSALSASPAASSLEESRRRRGTGGVATEPRKGPLPAASTKAASSAAPTPRFDPVYDERR